MDASEFLLNQAARYQQFASFQWLIHFGILSLIPVQGSLSYAEVAAAAKVPEIQLKSIARMAMTSAILREPVAGHLAHSELSAQFIWQPNLLDWAEYMTSTSAPVAAKMAEQTARWGSTTAKNETAFNVARDTTLPFFDYLAESPDRTQQFARYMKNVTTSDGINVRHLLSGFDWAALGAAKIVDVGGSSGHASIALATAYPDLKCIVQDLSTTIAESQTNLSTLPESVASRISFQPHDFFTPQPVRDADVYLLRMIIHDWPANEARTILQHLVDALYPGARVVIMDTLLPTPGSISADREAQLRVRDLTMMQTFNSKEREMEDWEELLASIDPPLKIKNLEQPGGSVMAVIEAVEAVVGEKVTPIEQERLPVESVEANSKAGGGDAVAVVSVRELDTVV